MIATEKAIIWGCETLSSQGYTLKSDIPEEVQNTPCLCKTLSDYAIKPTLVQCDFHDNNILIDEVSQKITFIDQLFATGKTSPWVDG